MSRLLEPRSTPEGAWKRWSKTSLKLTGRLWLSALPLTLTVGLLVGWGFWETGLWLGLLLLPFTGLWQAALLTLAERAAAGKRVTVGDAWEGVATFCRQCPKQVGEQLRDRTLLGVGALAAFGVIIGLAWVLEYFLGPRAVSAATPEKTLGPLAELAEYASLWALMWIWAWGCQRGGYLSGVQSLVRRYGLSWQEAELIWNRAFQLNRHNLAPFVLPALLVSQLMLFVPYIAWAMFLAEIWWACVVAVMMRDVFEHQDALAAQEERAAATQAHPSLG